MNIKVLDFEQILKNYTNYHDSLKSIQQDKKDFSDKIDQIKSEMQTIMNSARTLVLDESLKMRNEQKLKDLQMQGIQLESEFRSKIVEKQNSELEKNFQEITKIVEDWSSKNSVSLVINKNNAVYSSSEYDITDEIKSIIKELGLYKEYTEDILENI